MSAAIPGWKLTFTRVQPSAASDWHRAPRALFPFQPIALGLSWNNTGRAVGVKVYEQFSNAARTCLFLLRRFLQLLRTDECPQLCTRLSRLCPAFPAQQVYAGLLSIIPRRAQYLLAGAAAGIGAWFSWAPCSQAAPDPPQFFGSNCNRWAREIKGGGKKRRRRS